MREHLDPARPAYFEYAHSNKRRNISTYSETSSGCPEPKAQHLIRICEYYNLCTQTASRKARSGRPQGGSVGKYGFVIDQRKCVGCRAGYATYARVTPRFVPRLRRRLAELDDVAVRGKA